MGASSVRSCQPESKHLKVSLNPVETLVDDGKVRLEPGFANIKLTVERLDRLSFRHQPAMLAAHSLRRRYSGELARSFEGVPVEES